ncbi:MAG: OmpA family protein [Gammaproteobacteria bacterium]|nr:OmpA family protein [Gammaproteobacteria bacterium]
MADDCPKCEEGLPGWLATFADLMSLLMCFFVLLLSFATVDAVRFKKMAESMKDAFGVQREVPAPEIVMGVSVIKQEWSPTVAEQAVITEIRQETTDEQREHLKLDQGQGESAATSAPPESPQTPATDERSASAEQQAEIDEAAALQAAKEALDEDLMEQLAELQKALQGEIEQGIVSLERKESNIIIRIHEKGSFASGSARLDPEFHEVMGRISGVLAPKPGRILVAGHTDNIPISTGRFRSNWELSSARAVTVLHSLLRNKDIAENRVVVQGFADTQPMEPNDTPQNRAKNRRVELILIRGLEDNFDDVQGLNDLQAQ